MYGTIVNSFDHVYIVCLFNCKQLPWSEPLTAVLHIYFISYSNNLIELAVHSCDCTDVTVTVM